MAFMGVIPEAPSFGSQIARGLGGGLSQGLMQKANFAQQMAIQKQKSQPLVDLLGRSSGAGSEKFQPFSPQQEAMLALTNPSAFNAYKSLKESHAKEEEKATVKEDLSNVLGQMSETLLGGNLGITAKKYISPQGRRDKQYFDSLGVQLESIAKDMVSKGVLARDRFNYLLKNLPGSDKTDAANAGALEAWSDELKIPRPDGLESLYKKQARGPQTSSKAVPMTDSEGNRYNIPADKVKQAEQQGFKRE